MNIEKIKVPQEIINQGGDAIRQYIREQRQKQGKMPSNEEAITTPQASNVENVTPTVSQPEQSLTGMDRARLAAQGLLFGFSDEIIGGAKSLFTDQTYEQARDAEREKIRLAREQAPVEAALLELGGSVPTALIPFLGAARIAQLGGKGANVAKGLLSNPVKVALGEGAVQGAGYTEGEAGDFQFVTDVAKDALFSAGATKGLDVLGGLAKGTFNTLTGDRVSGDDAILRAIARDRDTPEGLKRKLEAQQADRALPESVANVAGENVRRMVDASMQEPTTVRRQAVDQLNQVRNEQSDRIRAEMTSKMGEAGGGRQYVEDLIQNAKKVNKKAYDNAYYLNSNPATPRTIDISDQSEILKLPEFRDGLERANRLIALQNKTKTGAKIQPIPLLIEVNQREYMGKMVEDLTFTGARPTVQQMDYLKRGVYDSITQGSKEGGIGAAEVGSYKTLLRQFVDAIDSKAGAYRIARKQYGDNLSIQEAYDTGADFFKKSVSADDLAFKYKKFNDNEKKAFKAKVMDDLNTRLEALDKTAVDQASDAVKRVYDGYQKKFEVVLGKAEADDLRKVMQRESEIYRGATTVQGGSQTAGRQAEKADVTNTGANRIPSILYDPVMGIGSAAVDKIMSKANKAKQEALLSRAQRVNERIVPLTTPDPVRARQILEELERSGAAIDYGTGLYGGAITGGGTLLGVQEREPQRGLLGIPYYDVDF
tara:strand:- start:57 stop:2189 length:2133 start_codon:yes stop_codon:yes gene_type:complete